MWNTNTTGNDFGISTGTRFEGGGRDGGINMKEKGDLHSFFGGGGLAK
jgi:hypothetical protein